MIKNYKFYCSTKIEGESVIEVIIIYDNEIMQTARFAKTTIKHPFATLKLQHQTHLSKSLRRRFKIFWGERGKHRKIAYLLVSADSSLLVH